MGIWNTKVENHLEKEMIVDDLKKYIDAKVEKDISILLDQHKVQKDAYDALYTKHQKFLETKVATSTVRNQ